MWVNVPFRNAWNKNSLSRWLFLWVPNCWLVGEDFLDFVPRWKYVRVSSYWIFCCYLGFRNIAVKRYVCQSFAKRFQNPPRFSKGLQNDSLTHNLESFTSPRWFHRKKVLKKDYPRCSLYGLCAYIWIVLGVKVYNHTLSISGWIFF